MRVDTTGTNAPTSLLRAVMICVSAESVLETTFMLKWTSSAMLLSFWPCLPVCADTRAAGAKTTDEAANRAQPAWYWLGTLTFEASIRAPDPADYTLNLADGRVAIQADCNLGTGTYTLQNDSLSVGPIAPTRMACRPGSRGEQYSKQLQFARRLTEQDGVLQLDLGSEGGTMFFARELKARLFHYRCREGTTLSAIFMPGQAQAWFGGQYFKLPQVPAGSGARYDDGTVSFHTKGTMGTLSKGDQVVARDCQTPSDARP